MYIVNQGEGMKNDYVLQLVWLLEQFSYKADILPIQVKSGARIIIELTPDCRKRVGRIIIIGGQVVPPDSWRWLTTRIDDTLVFSYKGRPAARRRAQ